MKFNSLEVGGVYYTVTKHKMGNTTIGTISIHKVVVLELDADGEVVTASWNGNSPRKFYSFSYSKWKKNKPMTVTSGLGSVRLATKQEREAAKA